MSKVDLRNIEKNDAVCGGRAVVAGTRVRVAVILSAYRRGISIEEIVQQYPHLRPGDVHDALAYAYEHADEVEADIDADNEAVAMRQWPGGKPDA